jgi:deoxyadenosine/deoxycytidine kinase
MGRVIIIVGNSGVGKTTLARALSEVGSFATGLEEPGEHPFQELFSKDLQRYSLANQVDYLLYRAEQEQAIRASGRTGLLDGGLEMDYYVFTRLFRERGYLAEEECHLCDRLYALFRVLLPFPDAVIRLTAPLEVIAERYTRRGRILDIAELKDLARIESLIDEWLAGIGSTPIIVVDASQDDFCSEAKLEALLQDLIEVLKIEGIDGLHGPRDVAQGG